MKKGTETKERIIQKALDLFHERGYFATSMNDIVDFTGVKKGNLYFHYKSKEELAVEVLKEALREYENFITARINGTTPLAKLISMIEGIVAFHIEKGNGRGCIFGNMALESKDNSSSLSDFVKSVFVKWERNICDLITKSINTCEISAVDLPDNYARIIIAQIEGGIMLSRIYADYRPLRECADVIIADLNKKRKGRGRC
jgi:TetR/AcrR family transcriptional repressor of nem operon